MNYVMSQSQSQPLVNIFSFPKGGGKMPPVLSKFDKIEQRAVIKLCVKVGKSAAEIVEQLEKAFGGNSLKRRAVYQWHK